MPQQKPVADAIRPYLDQRLTVHQISKACGVSMTGVYNAIRLHGWNDRVRYKNRAKSQGRVNDVFLQEHIYKWVAKQCPDGTRVDEMITAIVTDAYFEAMEDGKC